MDVLTAISLCSGYEGLGLGLKRAIPNVRTVCYVERETYAVANLVAKIKEGKLDDAPIWDDLATFDPKPFEGMVHIIHGGYPCQSFSVAGKRLGTKDPRWVWPHIERIIEAVEPVWCIFENVPGHLSIGLPEVYCSLRNMGYSVEAGLFSAAECGLCHQRKRLYILAHAENGRNSRRDGGSDSKWQHLAQSKPNDRNGTSSETQGCISPSWPARFRNISEIPRVDDEGRNWVDRLRLLGNGVVPQCAEKAIRELSKLFENN